MPKAERNPDNMVPLINDFKLFYETAFVNASRYLGVHYIPLFFKIDNLVFSKKLIVYMVYRLWFD